MITVTALCDKTQKDFEILFTAYYKELGCEDDTAHLLKEYIIPDLKAGIISIDIAKEDDVYIGFVIYQKDDIDNEWNLKEGWGDVREIFVIPPRRRQGLGKFLLFTAELKLRERGVQKSYCLPCENAEKFFAACGYSKTDAYSADLDCCFYEKSDLTNKCK